MNKNCLLLFIIICTTLACSERNKKRKETSTNQVNVFLGTSGDHGQMSPAASSPFNMMSIGPQTNPHTHTGYEYYAKNFDGFTHTRIEGVGCKGSGGNILIKPILEDNKNTILRKIKEEATPGFYSVAFENGIKAEMSVNHNFGIHEYQFPQKKSSILIDLSYAFENRFVAEEHTINENTISGFIDTKTTCGAGKYRIYYSIEIDNLDTIKGIDDHVLLATRKDTLANMKVKIGFSSVNTKYAQKQIKNNSDSIETIKKKTAKSWEKLLSKVQVEGETERKKLFYSLLYRGLQAPYLISENDGTYRAIDGSMQKSKHPVYNGWAIWDNYREQLPMLSLLYPEKFESIAKSIGNLYKFGKKDWATEHEPSPTVRTEHASVVLLDAYKKGYPIDFESIKKHLIKEADQLDYSSPNKALESAYDNWAISEIFEIIDDTLISKKYKEKASEYKNAWLNDFADLSKPDIDNMQARGLYQGTIWQYRWFVPFDIAGLKKLTGNEDEFLKQLDQFFNDNNYNHANQPDLQVPGLYNATKQPWKSQKLFRELLLDTVVQNYFNNNSKGVDPYVGRIYKLQPKSYLRTMDDDAGTMSSWFVMRSLGLSPANVGDPIYYLTAPIFKSIKIKVDNDNSFTIRVKNYHKDHFYIQSAYLNGVKIERNWLTQDEIRKGGDLILETSSKPNKKWGIKNQWISNLEKPL
ncbi:glycoside hydrolase domain-containing protein [Zunongwangia sp. HGR-M22]|uniref:glycoside hydrolase domain-containing protein n=1 Tax=Zunongwangia sp. HGR-M22 TaxID=3015168 RepID=UPI0022DD8A61|nr:glycoside hydrolase domain-containing protein [Zunongwangia sp. HGR-M22]WBL24329.1 glycoside hydrolase family 92 protein [Zunongwangia sp. HGR-M22]